MIDRDQARDIIGVHASDRKWKSWDLISLSQHRHPSVFGRRGPLWSAEVRIVVTLEDPTTHRLEDSIWEAVLILDERDKSVVDTLL